MQTRYQHGELKTRKRRKGPDVWQWRWYDESGKRRAVIVGTIAHLSTKAAAERAVDALRLKINSQLPQARLHQVTVNAVIDRYLNEVAPCEVRKQTQRSYHSYAKHVRARWGSETLRSVDDPIAIEVWLKTLSQGTAPHVRNFFHMLFQWARRWRYVDANPVTLVRTSRKRNKIPRVLKPKEVRALLAELGEPYKTMVQLCCALGLRACELLALQWGDFDWRARTVLVQRSVVQGEVNPTKTEASQKAIPLGPELVKALRRLKSRTSYPADSDYVFASDTGKPRWQGILLTDHIKPAAIRAGIGKIGWHTFRHTNSTLLHELGAPLAVQKELLRHSDIQTTMNVYTQAVSLTKRRAAEKVQRILLRKKSA